MPARSGCGRRRRSLLRASVRCSFSLDGAQNGADACARPQPDPVFLGACASRRAGRARSLRSIRGRSADPFHVTTLYSRWVTPGASTARTCSSCTSASPTLSKRRAPSPSTTGTTWSSSSSSSPAARYCRATSAPPQSLTSLPPAASLACSSADSIPSRHDMKRGPSLHLHGITPVMGEDEHGAVVREGRRPTSPSTARRPRHHRRSARTCFGPSRWPRRSRPMPRLSVCSRSPRRFRLSWDWRQAASGTTQSWSRSPDSPSRFCSLWFGPATKPSHGDRDMTPEVAPRSSSVGVSLRAVGSRRV